MSTSTMTLTASTKRLHIQPTSTPALVPSSTSPVHSITKSGKNDFTWTSADEPHAARRTAILKAHPEVRQLFVTEPRTAWIVLAIVILQLIMCYIVSEQSGFVNSYWTLLVLAYVIGGTANHSLQLAVHELSHNLGFQSPLANRVMALIANLPTGAPSAITFQRYHMDHHQWQGYDGK
jgi:sphingolipid delta-4 desaturase